MKMTKKDALEEFGVYILPAVKAKYGKDDHTAIREGWNNFTDILCKDGRITQRQYETWANSFSRGTQ